MIPVVIKKETNKSLYIFGEDGDFRKLCVKISVAKSFDHFILIIISISSVTLAFENPLNDPESLYTPILQFLE